MRSVIAVRKTVLLVVGTLLMGGWVYPAPASAAPGVTLQADTRVAAGSPSSNFGSATTLEVDASPLTESLVRFSVSDVDGAVTSAKLRAWVTNRSSNGPEVYLSNPSWDEATVTWNSRPARTSSLLADVGSVSAGTWVEWDVTSAVSGNGTYSFNLVADSSDGTDLATKEAGSNRPQLLVTTGTTPPPPPAAPGVTLQADTRVAAGSPSSNFGSATTLEVDASPLTESLVRFSVSDVDGAVTSAKLRAWVTNRSSNGPEVYLSNPSWDEATVTWNSRPARTSSLLADVGSVSAGTWVEWDVTSAVSGNGTYSFNLVADSSDGTDLATKEAGSNRPQLLVTTGTTPPPPPPPTTGIITTLAGIGTSGFSGDGGPAVTARLNAPRTMAADRAGNTYIIDTGNHRARRVDTSGRITTIAGTGTAGFSGDGGPATSARLHNPHGIAVDEAGNVYIADPPNQRIRKVDTTGRITTVAGNGTKGYNGDGIRATSARLNYPKGVEIGPDGLLYIADNNNHRVRMVDTAGIIHTVAGTGSSGFSGDGGPATAARLAEPRNVAFGADGTLYIVDQNNDRIREVSPGGTITTLASGFSLARDVAVDATGNVYVADESRKKVYRIDTARQVSTFAGNGSEGDSGDGGIATEAALDNPRGVAWDPARGVVLIADTMNHKVRQIG